MKPALVLASQSPRRRELLGILGFPFSVIPAAVDESPIAGESPEYYVTRVAREKGESVALRVAHSVVLSADTVVTIGGEILGKPVDKSDAFRMLHALSGRQHRVYTAVYVVDQIRSQVMEGLERTEVWFNPLTDSQILRYIEREDVMDKAGAYAIQGFAAAFISKIEGNYSNVMGLPLPLVYDFLCRTTIEAESKGR